MDIKKRERIFNEVYAELQRAEKKHSPINSSHEAYGVMQEEFDEMWNAIKKDDLIQARAEALSVAAMAIRFIQDVCDD